MRPHLLPSSSFLEMNKKGCANDVHVMRFCALSFVPMESLLGALSFARLIEALDMLQQFCLVFLVSEEGHVLKSSTAVQCHRCIVQLRAKKAANVRSSPHFSCHIMPKYPPTKPKHAVVCPFAFTGILDDRVLSKSHFQVQLSRPKCPNLRMDHNNSRCHAQ